jgi:hypothetical protein
MSSGSGVDPVSNLNDFDEALGKVAEEGAAHEQECLRLIAEGGMHIWSPGDPIPPTGKRLLIGYVTWSGYEQLLLQIVKEVMTGPNPPDIRVDVFDMDHCQKVEDFNDYIPGIGDVCCTPVVGLWVDGVLREKMACSPSRAIVARACGLEPSYIEGHVEEMVQKLQRRIQELQVKS